MINMMTNTGLIEIGGQEHGGKGWKDRIWRGQQKIFSPFYFVFFFSSALFWLFWIITGLFSNKIPSFISLGIHCYLLHLLGLISRALRFYSFGCFCWPWPWWLAFLDLCSFVNVRTFFAKITNLCNSEGTRVDDRFLQRGFAFLSAGYHGPSCPSLCEQCHLNWTPCERITIHRVFQKRLSSLPTPPPPYPPPPAQSHDGGGQISSCVPIVDV